MRKPFNIEDILDSLGLKQREYLIDLLNKRLIEDNITLFKSDCIYHKDEEDIEVSLNCSLFEWIKKKIQNMNGNNKMKQNNNWLRLKGNG